MHYEMKYMDVTDVLNKVNNDYYIAHCVSCDCAMGAGVALAIKNKFPDVRLALQSNPKIGDVILTGKIINLFTKQRFYDKPTMDDFIRTIHNLHMFCIDNNITHLAMPKIGCGLDRLKWNEVESLLFSVFKLTNISILVCMK